MNCATPGKSDYHVLIKNTGLPGSPGKTFLDHSVARRSSFADGRQNCVAFYYKSGKILFGAKSSRPQYWRSPGLLYIIYGQKLSPQSPKHFRRSPPLSWISVSWPSWPRSQRGSFGSLASRYVAFGGQGRKAFLSFREAAARLYDRTKAADVVFGSATRDNPDARLGYHAHQLVHYAKFGKVIFYGKKNPSPAMKPISRYDLSTGRRADDMRSWITEDSEEYGDLSVRHRDLRRVVRLVQRAVKVHQAQHANAPLRSPDSED